MNVVAGEDLGGGLGGAVGEEAAIVADQHAALLQPAAGDVVGQRLAKPAHVVQGKALANHRAPAAGAELDDVALFLAARAEQALEQDELDLLQVRACVDALDLVLVVDLIALHLEAGADQPVHRVGQPVFAVDRRRRQGLQHREDLLCGHDIRADV